MPEFLTLLPPLVALEKILAQLPPAAPAVEQVPSPAALGRILVEDILSPESLPAFPRSTVDGYAVHAADTYGASDSLPAYLSLAGEIPMGGAPGFALGTQQAALIHTGGMLPEGADAVVMVENTQAARVEEIEVQRAVARWENVLKTGEDVQVGEGVLPKGRHLRPADIGGLMALGILQVRVARPPRIAILSSGDEVVPPERTPGPGQVRDVNSAMLAAMVAQAGGEPVVLGIFPDRAEALQSGLRQALQACDAVVITAGSSASARDLTSSVIQQAGQPGVLVHGVNLKPGKPTILGVCDGKPVIGLPGNPVSAFVVARLFLLPIIEHLSGGLEETIHPQVNAYLSVNLASQAGREDWMPVILTQEGNSFRAEPVFYKSNLIFSLSRAAGLLYIPADATGIEAGEQVKVYLL